jgi:hypothetical protein
MKQRRLSIFYMWNILFYFDNSCEMFLWVLDKYMSKYTSLAGVGVGAG